MKRWVISVCALLSASASATTMVALEVDALSANSDAVVQGKVVSVTARWTSDHTRIITDTVLEVSEAWKGAPKHLITVMQPGGEVGEVGQKVEGIASFQVAEEVVLFLEARGERFTVAGMAQGRFRVERSSDGLATYTRQDQAAELFLIDPASHQPSARPPLVFALEALKKQVQLAPAAAARPKGTQRGTTR
jgi:hypothetical protein